MNSKKWLSLILTAIALNGAAASAEETKCYIYVDGPCVYSHVPVKQWFTDDYNNSGRSAGACLHRASEYRAYCAMPPVASHYVNAAFTLNGRTINAQQFRGPRNVTTFGLDWAPLVTE